MSNDFRPDGARFFQGRLVKDGPFVGLMTWFGQPYVDGEELDRGPRWQCLIGNETTARAILFGDYLPVEVERALVRNVSRIEEHEYRFLVAETGYCVIHAPDRPQANPHKPVDFNTLKVR